MMISHPPPQSDLTVATFCGATLSLGSLVEQANYNAGVVQEVHIGYPEYDSDKSAKIEAFFCVIHQLDFHM